MPDPILDLLDDVQSARTRTRPSGPGASSEDPILGLLDEVQRPTPTADSRSMLARAYDTVFTPPEAVTSAAADLANTIDQPTLDRSPWRARLEGFGAGALQGAASLLTPGDAVLTALGLGPVANAVRGVRGGARVLHGVQQAANLATVLRGAERAADADTVGEGLAGAAQAAFGSAGMLAGRVPQLQAPESAPVPGVLALPRGTSYVASPEGVVGRVGVDTIPMSQGADGSFSRSVPAASYVDDAGRQVFSGDPNARTVPRPIRGALPPGPRFHADASGRIAAADHVDELVNLLDDVQRTGPDRSGGRSVRPGIIEREIDPTVPAKQAIRVRQYSSDPAAVDAPYLTDEQRRVLEVMREDLRAFAPQRGRLVRDPNDPNSSIYAHGGPGSGVGDDIRVISEQNVGNPDIMQAIDDLLTGKAPTNRLHTAAIDAAQGFIEGRPGYRGPQLPLTDSGPAPTETDADAFLRAFDDVAPDPRGEPGEAGFISPELAARGGSAVVGAAAGYGTAEEGESPVKTAGRVALGALGGLAIGSAASGGRRLATWLNRLDDAPVTAITRQVLELRRTERTRPLNLKEQLALRHATRELTERGARVPMTDAEMRVLAPDLFAEVPTGERTPRAPGVLSERGAITAQVAQHVAGGVTGAAAGAASGDDTEDRIKRGLIYGAAGFALPAVLHRAGVSGVSRAQGPTLAPKVVAEAVAGVPRTGRSGEPMKDPLAGFEPFFAKFQNPLVREGVAKVIRDNNGFEGQRRGTISAQQLGEFANEVRVNVEKTLPRGTALSAEGVTAYARALQQITQKVNELGGRVRSGQATDADVLAFQAAQAEQAVVAKSLAGARSEAGRSLGAFNFWSSVLDTGSVDLIREVAHPLRDEAARIANGLAALPDDPMVRYRWLQTQQRATWGQHLRSYYLSNLLSGPLTHFRNILGNVSNAVFDTATLPVSAAIDAAKSAVTGAPRTVRLSELPAQVQGAVTGIEKGWQDAIFALRHGIHPAQLAQSVETAATRGRLDLPPVELPGGGYNPLNWPFRALHGPDAFFKSMARESELSAILFNQAKNEGLSGQALVDRVAVLRAGQQPEAVKLRQEADDYASRRVFLEKPGEITNSVVRLAEAIPGSFMVLPFIRITSSIARQGAQFSPFGFLMQAAKQGGRAGTQAQARATAGTLAAGYLFWLASSGRLSGNGPSDPNDRAALMESGWRPNSVKIGDTWYSYQAVQPLNVPAAVIANGVEAWRDRGQKSEDVPDVLAQVFARTGNSFLESTFLSGTYELVEALKDPERNAARFLGRTAAGFVPASSALRTVARVTDPVQRQPRGVLENLAAGVPGMSEQLEPRISRYGQTVAREGGPARRALDVFNSSTATSDPIDSELARLGVKVSLPSGAVPGILATTPGAETAAKQLRGQTVRRVLERVMADPRYERLSDENRAAALERVIVRARTGASKRQNQQAVRAAVGQTYSHPRYGAVRVMGMNRNGTIAVMPNGSRQSVDVKLGNLSEAQ